MAPAITFTEYQQTATGTKYAPRYPTDTVKWNGSLESEFASFTKVDDADGDGYFYPEAYGEHLEVDCNDDDESVNPGMAEIPNNGKDDDCDSSTPDAVDVDKALIAVTFVRHIVGMGSHPGSIKEPCRGAPMVAFDKTSECVTGYGVSWHHYEDIWTHCEPVAPYGKVSDSGLCNLIVPAGNYIIIGIFDPDGSAYNDPGNPSSFGDDVVFCGVSAGGVESGQTIEKYLQVIEKAGGKKVSGKSKKETGSELWIIEPEYVEWDGTEELYPFIFESVGDWSVTTSVSPPEGFVADHNSLAEDVNTELEAVQFTITDVGSEWKPTEVTYDLKHKGKKKKIKSKIGVKLSKKLAKEKGVDIYGNKIK